MDVTTKTRRSLDAFAKGLLATTCLTAAVGTPMQAGTIYEGTPPAPSDFPNEGPGYVLPLGTNVVVGSLGELPGEAGFDSSDWFQFQGLTPGAAYTFFAFYATEFGPNIFTDVYSGEGAFIFEGGLSTSYPDVVPADGTLVVELFAQELSFISPAAQASTLHPAAEVGPFAATYVVGLELGSTTPEPGTFGTAGAALAAGSLLWARRRKQ